VSRTQAWAADALLLHLSEPSRHAFMPDVSGHAFDFPREVVSTIGQTLFRTGPFVRQPRHSGDEVADFLFVLWSHRGAHLILG
jgi:hypothetical protein